MGGQFREWLGLLDPDIRYVVPVRTTREDSAGWVGAIAHWNDDYTGLEMRVLRGRDGFLVGRVTSVADPALRVQHSHGCRTGG